MNRLITLALPMFLMSMVLSPTLMAGSSDGQASPQAPEGEEGRILAGAILFPSFLAVDLDIVDKRGPDGKLLVVLVHNEEKSAAETLARRLKKTEKVRGIPLRVELMAEGSLDGYGGPVPAAIFIVERLFQGLETIIQYANEHHVLVFSPLEGDVERGVTGGIFISDKVYPYVNMDALRSAGLHLKPFFLRVARRYE